MASIRRLSNLILSLEKAVVTLLAGILLLLILVNIATRAAGAALFWIDELAIFTMIWMALIAASAMVRMRVGVSVTLVTDLLPPRLKLAVSRVVDALMLVFALALLIVCWIWYDPLALARSGFDFDRFAQETFKFIYSQPTNTIGIRKFWIWLVVPLMSVDMTIHALANLIDGPGEAPEPGEDGARSRELGL